LKQFSESDLVLYIVKIYSFKLGVNKQTFVVVTSVKKTISISFYFWRPVEVYISNTQNVSTVSVVVYWH
jgi:hypothetical protein